MAFLGLDVGGSKCRFEWWPRGAAAGGDGRSVQPAVHGVDAAAEGLANVLREAARAGAPTAAVCALAGVGDAATSAALVDGLRRRGIDFPVAVVGDVLAAAATALAAGPGVLVWAGTGSFAVARAVDGSLWRVGGRGYLLGDQGSGYDLVRRAARAALLAVDGIGPATALVDDLVAAFAAPSPQRLGAVLQRLAPGEVAARLGTVLAVAARGDVVAQQALAEGAADLDALADAAVRKAGLAWRSLSTAAGGGVFDAAPDYLAAVAARLTARGAVAPVLVAPRAAAVGAAWLAEGWHRGQSPQKEWVDRVAF
ncbi:MAG: BadF/BadG/BcrA/BcrD ATPase family protein [Planctomycetota bacterium]